MENNKFINDKKTYLDKQNDVLCLDKENDVLCLDKENDVLCLDKQNDVLFGWGYCDHVYCYF